MSLPWPTALILVTSALFVLHLTCAVGGTPPGKISKDAPPSGPPQQNNKAPLIGAYYYNWYNIEDQWKKYPRAHEPTLGEYDIKEHDFAIEKHHRYRRCHPRPSTIISHAICCKLADLELKNVHMINPILP
jgi:hypothetical protein